MKLDHAHGGAARADLLACSGRGQQQLHTPSHRQSVLGLLLLLLLLLVPSCTLGASCTLPAGWSANATLGSCAVSSMSSGSGGDCSIDCRPPFLLQQPPTSTNSSCSSAGSFTTSQSCQFCPLGDYWQWPAPIDQNSALDTAFVAQGVSGLDSTSALGNAITLSADGSVMVGGASGCSSNTGAVLVYQRSGAAASSSYSQTQLLSGGAAGDQFGAAVLLSADATTLLVGQPGHGGNGGVSVYTRAGVGANYAIAGSVLSSGSGSYFGCSMALSLDSSVLIIGGRQDNSSAGAVWVYALSGGQYVMGSKVTPSGASGGAQFGTAVALSGDGTFLAVGAPCLLYTSPSPRD